jgi:hypothetical protein
MDPNWEIPFSYSEFSKICSGEKEVVGYIGFYSGDEEVFRLLEGLFSGNSYISLSFDGNVIEIFNKSKNDVIRGKNWSLISKVLKDVIK